MFDTLDFAQDILAQEINPTCCAEAMGLPSLNRQHLIVIVAYQHLVDNWDEDGAIAPTHQMVLSAVDIALLLIVKEQPRSGW